MLTSLRELDRLILLDLDVKSIWSYSQVCQECSAICDNSLWRELVRRDLNVQTKHDPANEQYYYIITVSFHDTLESGRIDALEYIHQSDPVCEYEAEEACSYGHFDMLKWVLQQGIKPSIDCLEHAIAQDQHEIFEYLWPITPHPLTFWRGPSSVSMLQRLIQLGYPATEDWASCALFGSNKELLEIYYQDGILPDMTALIVSAEGECYETFVWMYEHGVIPNQECINTVAAYGHLEVLKYLYDRGLLPEVSSLAGACSRGKLEILIWFEDNNLGLPDEEGSRCALLNGYLHVVEWLIDRDIHPYLLRLRPQSEELTNWIERYQTY